MNLSDVQARYVIDALTHAADSCRFHGVALDSTRHHGVPELPACDSCKQPYRVQRARAAMGMTPVKS